MENSDSMRKGWEELWNKLRAQSAPQGVFDELIRAYSLPDRFYHNFRHIEDCLSIFDQTEYLAAHAAEVELALWFHDAVYDTRRNDNEQRSAEWAASVIDQSDMDQAVAERVFKLILATRHTMEISDKDAQLIVDIDLSIFGRESPAFWQYEENIRKEYAWVPESLYRQKRIEILRGFLDRPHIYYHEQVRNRFEEGAHANLLQAIARLSTL